MTSKVLSSSDPVPDPGDNITFPTRVPENGWVEHSLEPPFTLNLGFHEGRAISADEGQTPQMPGKAIPPISPSQVCPRCLLPTPGLGQGTQ